MDIKEKIECPICERMFGKTTIKHHMKTCKGKHVCKVCGKAIRFNLTTCSHSCSNTYFRSGENHGNWKQDTYKTTCFLYHKKECIVCGENKIVAVHHANGNHNDNSTENLIPLCPTHHQYAHSRYRLEVQPVIDAYIENRKLNL